MHRNEAYTPTLTADHQTEATTPDLITELGKNGGLFAKAAQALLGRHLTVTHIENYGMPTHTTRSRDGENHAGDLLSQVIERAKRLQASEITRPYSHVGRLVHATTEPASSHTSRKDGHYINWLFGLDGAQASFVSAQELAALSETEPPLYAQAVGKFADGITATLKQVSLNTGVPIKELLTYYQTGATDPKLRQKLGFSRGAASLPLLHAHTIAPGEKALLSPVQKPVEVMLKQYQTIDTLLMQLVGDDLVSFIHELLPEQYTAEVVTGENNTTKSFSRHAGIEVSFGAGIPVSEALDHSLQILKRFEPISQAAIAYVGSGKTDEEREKLRTVIAEQGFSLEATEHFLRFLRIMQPTTKQLTDPIDVAKAVEKYTKTLQLRRKLHLIFAEQPAHRKNLTLQSKYIWILHELDRLRPSPEQLEMLGISNYDRYYLELDKESLLTASDPLSVDFLLHDFVEQEDGEVLVQKLWLHLPIVGHSGAIDTKLGYTLLR